MNDDPPGEWPKRTFFDLGELEGSTERGWVVILPAPYEGTVSYGRGASKGPRAILEASWNVELYDVVFEDEPYKRGIRGLKPLSFPEGPDAAVELVREATRGSISAGKSQVMLGGEHSLTAGAVAAAKEHCPGLSVLQLDAHADLRDSSDGTLFSHACVMRRIAEMGLPFVQAGIRSMCPEERDWISENKPNIFYSHKILKDPDWVSRVIEPLSDVIYLTLDLDVLDPSEMPSTGTPEPGGLSYYNLIDLFAALKASGKKVVAADLMELAPIKGLIAPDFLAAKLLYILCSLA